MSVTEFNQLIAQKINEQIPVQTVWATVKDVDWENKTMTATGLIDDLDYFDVLLGIGDHYCKPIVGTNCLIGSVDNSANTFLISASEVEETIFTSGDSELTIKEDGFIIKQSNESLKKVFNDMIDEINKIIVINGTSINVAAMTAIKQRLNTVLIE
ncbi:hypothetical protein [Flavobacterium johnsoniae]|uniref:Uncharacterized protein n=1 Tax=Flavobacterium johnsoniae TaxID=986 RepID=A0A1M5VJ48_FLAJO|nr:hypothetical protein [Flavobacterium johnsoniae]SHH75220.1 hypothetical protein SAMN05444388_1188 [Flavobacterium johnsoniae]